MQQKHRSFGKRSPEEEEEYEEDNFEEAKDNKALNLA